MFCSLRLWFWAQVYGHRMDGQLPAELSVCMLQGFDPETLGSRCGPEQKLGYRT